MEPGDQGANQVIGSGGSVELRPGLSVVIPIYNSEATIPALVDRLSAALTAAGRPFEVILVNDGSRDASWMEIARLSRNRPWLRGLDLSRNFGQHNALLTGLRSARHEVAVTLDDDLQHPPEVIPALLEALTDEVDIVYGRPRVIRQSARRRVATRAMKFAMARAMGARLAEVAGPLRVFRTSLREGASGFHGPMVNLDVLLSWTSHGTAVVEFEHAASTLDRSRYDFGKLVLHTLNLLTGFSIWPLRLATMLGLVATALGIVLLGYVILRFIVNGPVVPGFAFLASALSIFSGVQLLILGILGEYLGRVHQHGLGMPISVVRRRAGYED